MKRTLQAVLLALVTFLAGGELLCRLLPVSTATETGFYLDPLIKTYPPHHLWIASSGWDLRRPQRMIANNMGFAAEHDFVPNPEAIALIGDSYVEASMLPLSERLAHQMEKALDFTRPVWALGNPGTSLLDYAERIRFAHARFGVRDMVLLVEAGDVRQSVCGSGNVEGVCLEPATWEPTQVPHTPPSAVKKLVRHSAFAQYLFSQLKVDGARLWRQLLLQAQPGQAHGAEHTRAVASQPSTKEPQIALVNAVADAFLQRVSGHVMGRLIMVVDGARGRPGEYQMWNRAERVQFLLRMRAAGVTVVDAEPIFLAHSRQSVLSTAVAPDDAHMNALGLALLVGPTAQAIRRSAMNLR